MTWTFFILLSCVTLQLRTADERVCGGAQAHRTARGARHGAANVAAGLSFIFFCFSNVLKAHFKRRQALVDTASLESELTSLRAALSAKEDECNDMVEKYNDTIVANRALTKRIGNLEAKLLG